MTRRDYVLISKCIADVPPTDDANAMAPGEDMRRDITLALAKAISAQNPTFNATQFIQACGFGR